MNILNYIYFYNGGGVGVGDVNNDGLQDLFFAGNLVNSRLYINQGNFQFKDITESAGIDDAGWSTGVSMVDINGDGFLDIYVAQAGYSSPKLRKNLLYLNNGDLTFTESAESFGISDSGYTTHSAFFDYDLDGDLDLYVLNHGNDRNSLNTPRKKELNGENPNTDVLYRNNGDFTFTNVSNEAGITIEGYGLGLAVSDLNGDGFPDLYISNDFISNDILYFNKGDGTFENRIEQKITEQSYNGMGVDINDFNNDAKPDIMALDMLPPDPRRRKTMAGSMTYDKFSTILKMDYQPQFVRNTLHLNEGGRFREIGRFAGVHSTDWSWAPLFFDADRDGFKDLFITNGYLKDITDKDFMDYENNLNMFQEGKEGSQLERIEELNGVKLPNYIFSNNGDQTFQDKTMEWGMNIPSYSNGAAYADLDGDGDLDLVINNINTAPLLLENKINKGHYVQFRLLGGQENPSAVGSRINLYCEGEVFTNDVNPYRGFMSSVSDQVFFGLGEHDQIDSAIVYWPEGKLSRHYDLPVDTVLELRFSAHASTQVAPSPTNTSEEEISIPGLEMEWELGFINSFKKRPLYPMNTISNLPIMATGDLNADGKEDLIINNLLFFQADKAFSKTSLAELKNHHINDVLVSDLNGDGMNDLYFACGTDIRGENDMIYFSNSEEVYEVSQAASSTRTVSNFDIDQDGDQDLFLGTDRTAKVLINEGGSFRESSEFIIGSDLPGIKDSAPADMNGDGWIDVVVAFEWGPVSVILNENGKLGKVVALSDDAGLWQSLLVKDLNNDGLPDVIGGNVGLNGPMKASKEEPITLIMADPDSNGVQDPMITHYVLGKKDVFTTRELLFSRYPFYSRKYRTHQSFANTSIEELLEVEKIKHGQKKEVDQLSSMYWMNRGELNFEPEILNDALQYFAISGFAKLSENSDLILAEADQQYRFYDGETFGRGNGKAFLFENGRIILHPMLDEIPFSLKQQTINIEGYGLCMVYVDNKGKIRAQMLNIEN